MSDKKILRECLRCHRIEYADEGQRDKMTQPDGEPCGGRFALTGRSQREQQTVEGLWHRLQR